MTFFNSTFQFNQGDFDLGDFDLIPILVSVSLERCARFQIGSRQRCYCNKRRHGWCSGQHFCRQFSGKRSQSY